MADEYCRDCGRVLMTEEEIGYQECDWCYQDESNRIIYEQTHPDAYNSERPIIRRVL